MKSLNNVNKNMRNIAIIISIILVAGGFFAWQYLLPQKVDFDELVSNPEKYNGKNVLVEGFYFNGFEVTVLSKQPEQRGFAGDVTLLPTEPYIWLGIKSGDFENLYEQINGYREKYALVRIVGKFEYGGKYGHMGAYKYQINNAKMKVLGAPKVLLNQIDEIANRETKVNGDITAFIKNFLEPSPDG